MKLRLRQNIIPWLKDQLSRPQWFRNFFITRNAWASFSVYSHVRRSTGTAKKTYSTKEAALKVAEKESFKKGVHFSVYKCLYCDGWHCGKNAQNKLPEPKNDKEKYLFMPHEVLRDCLVTDPVVTMAKLRETGVMQYAIPELVDTYNKPQKDGQGTVWEHILRMMDEIKTFPDIKEGYMPVMVMSIILLEIQNEQTADEIMSTLKFSKNETNDVRLLINLCMEYEKMTCQDKRITDSQIRKLQYKCKTEEFFQLLITLLLIKSRCSSSGMPMQDDAKSMNKRTAQMKAEGTDMFGFKGFLTAKELMEVADVKPGPEVKKYLGYLLELAFDDPQMDKEQVVKKLDEYKST